jgi:hypothetical protein
MFSVFRQLGAACGDRLLTSAALFTGDLQAHVHYAFEDMTDGKSTIVIPIDRRIVK